MSSAPPSDQPSPRADISEAGAVASALASIAEGQRLQLEQTRRDQRRRSWWRWGIFVVLVVAALGVAFGGEAGRYGAHVARVSITGAITDDPFRDELFRELAQAEEVEAVIVRIDSPGGSVVGGEALYESLRKVAAEKPVVAVLGETAASAGYMTAIAADHIVSRATTITGSIGVILTLPNVSEIMDAVGVSMREVRSGPRKAQPSMFEPFDVEEILLQQLEVDEMARWFMALVRERRNLTPEIVREMSDGRIVVGYNAVKKGLVDEIGGEAEALAWLSAERGIEEGLPVFEHAPETPQESPLDGFIPQVMARYALTALLGDHALEEVAHRALRLTKGLQFTASVE